MVIPLLANKDLMPMLTYTLPDAFRTNSRNIIGRNHSMVIPLLANQDLTPMLFQYASLEYSLHHEYYFPKADYLYISSFDQKYL